MLDSINQALDAALGDRLCIGQILIRKTNGGFVLSHLDDEDRDDLQRFTNEDDAIEIAKVDALGNYRPLKTAPNLRCGWRLELETLEQLKGSLDHFYPGRLAVFISWKNDRLQTSPLRETLDRQSGMYRVAVKISDEQIDDLVAGFCRSDSGCLRTILWKRDQRGAIASTKLPKEKFDASHDQTGRNETSMPLLCQEACNLLVAECRKVVRGE